MNALLILATDYWPAVLGLVAAVVSGLAGCLIRVGGEPYTYDDRLAQREIDILKANAEEEAYASRQRRRVRAGRTL